MKLPQDLFANPFRMQPGLKRIAAGEKQFTPIAPGSAAFEEKLKVLCDAAQDGLLITPGFDHMPALRRAFELLAHEHPDAVKSEAGACFLPLLGIRMNTDTGICSCDALTLNKVREVIQVTLSAQKPAAWAALALTVLEDLAVLRAPQGELELLSVCLPSHWAPQEKIGKPFVQVHAPVADNTVLLAAAQGLMRLVTNKGDDRWERYVWTLTPSLALDGHPKRQHREWLQTSDDAAFAKSIAFRLERQTFIALPENQQAIFTIKVQTAPLFEALNVDELAQLRESLATMSEAVLSYRSFGTVRERLLNILAHKSIYSY
jgi:dimethylamine monooxygenase subunit A